MEKMVYNTIWDKVNAYLLFLMPILILGVLFRVITFPVVAMLIFLSFGFLCNNHEKSVVCALVFCKLFGTFGPALGLRVPGTIVALGLMVIFLRKDLLLLLDRMKSRSMFFTIAIFFIFFIYFLLTAETRHSTSKLSVMSIMLIIDAFAFMILVTFDDIRMDRLTIPFLLFAMMQLGYVESMTGRGPSSLFDFSFFRNSCVSMMRNGLPVLSYHNMGIAAFLASSFMISQKKKLNTIFDYVFLFCSFWLIVLSGARQTIFGFILLISVWVVFRTGKVKLSTVFMAASIFIMLYLSLKMLDVPFLQQQSNRGVHMGSDLNRNYDYPLMLISNNFLDGIGFGNYNNPYTHEVYPHNIILEILCEFGFLGMILVSLVLIAFVRSHHFYLRNELPSGGICLLIWIPYLVRSMISGDLSENISLFVSLFVLFYYRGIVINGKKLEDMLRMRRMYEMRAKRKLEEAKLAESMA